MPLDPNLVGHETQPQTDTVRAEDIRQFADAVGDGNPIFHDQAAAQHAGYDAIAAMPTFVTRFRVPFAEIGLDTERAQVLHGDQEYTYTRPFTAGVALTVRHRVASIRQTRRADNMAIIEIEQRGDGADGQRVVTGRATVIVRDAQASQAARAVADVGEGAESAAPSRKARQEPQGEAIPSLAKRITQEQIDAYAEVSGDHNPIHLNPEAARAVGLDGTIAHGMLSMAFLGQLLTDWLAQRTSESGTTGWVARLRARFQAMARPGDTLTCRGVRVGAPTQGRQRVEVWIDNQRGERVITGDADVVVTPA
jgi:acyl dehydratase